MNINITTKKDHYIGLQIFDTWYAYRQNLNVDYKSDFSFTINKEPSDINILFEYMPEQLTIEDIEAYDLVFFCNGGESMSLVTPVMEHLLNLDKVYLICNSYLPSDHKLYNKTIWFPHNFMSCRDYWTRHFYPQYFENKKHSNLKRQNNIVAINGKNRPDRDFFFNLLSKSNLDIIIKSNLQSGNYLAKQPYESSEDIEFRNYVNGLYKFNDDFQTGKDYWSNKIYVGNDKKFGMIPMGYFIMPEYYQHACVIFPESGWLNDELVVTEKSIKCFHAESLPFPIGGANINHYYNELGFSTAWNLLPKELHYFDTIKNHVDRYQLAIEAISWLDNNRYVFESDQYKKMTKQNKISFLTCDSDFKSALRIDNIIQHLTKSKV